MKIEVELSPHAAETIRTLKLRGETNAECADRLLANLLQISYDKDNYAQHFGPQRRRTKESK